MNNTTQYANASKFLDPDKIELPKSYKETTLKDIDFENMVTEKMLSLDIAQEDIVLILKTIERDIEFLQRNGLMDYSLLLGIEKINKIN
jgi:hypothetical protein